MQLDEAQAQVLEAFKANPPYFVEKALGYTLYDKQKEAMWSVIENERTSISGANGVGKDFVAGLIALWWLFALKPSKVIVFAPTWRQVNDIVFNEIRDALRNKRIAEPWGFKAYRTPKVEDIKDPQNHFILGLSTGESAAESSGHVIPTGAGLAGFHSANLLVIISEAHAVSRVHYTTLMRLNPQRLLLTGNPFTLEGEFYDSHHSKKANFNTFKLSAFDTPNLSPEAPDEGYDWLPGVTNKSDVRKRQEEWGVENPLYTSGVLAEFPTSLESVLIPLAYVHSARDREVQVDSLEPIILTCDVAGGGKDTTVVRLRKGAISRGVWKSKTQDTMEIVGFLRQYCTENPIDTLVIDTVGIGRGVYDRLAELRSEGNLNVRLVSFQGGNKATKPTQFADRNAEVWWAMREWFLSNEVSIDNDEELIAQVGMRAYAYRSDKVVELESKRKMAKSPDCADALAMSFAIETGFRGMPDQETNKTSRWDIEPTNPFSGLSVGLSDGRSRWSI